MPRSLVRVRQFDWNVNTQPPSELPGVESVNDDASEEIEASKVEVFPRLSTSVSCGVTSGAPSWGPMLETDRLPCATSMLWQSS
jgi:hypothetical protein